MTVFENYIEKMIEAIEEPTVVTVSSSALVTPASAPDDTELAAGQALFWVNEVGNLLTVKVKYSDGTVKSGTIALI